MLDVAVPTVANKEEMRIATWNLERGGRTRAARTAQEETLRALGADIIILTEPPPSYKPRANLVGSPALRPGPRENESWVVITGRSLEPMDLDTPYTRMAVAARALVEGRTVVIYGAVLPWLSVRSHAPDLVRAEEDFNAVFTRVLEEQKSDLERLRITADLVVWAGDFNQSLRGPLRGCSRKGRTALNDCLAALGFVAWNDDAAHARPDLRAVDLLCGPKSQAVRARGRINPVRDGIVMSDHAGYWVDL